VQTVFSGPICVRLNIDIDMYIHVCVCVFACALTKHYIKYFYYKMFSRTYLSFVLTTLTFQTR